MVTTASTAPTVAKNSKVSKIYYYGTGRDKTSSARVFMYNGTGNITVNGKNLEKFFSNPSNRMIVMQPLKVINNINSFDFKITVKGGGFSGQADAIRLGIARALVQFDESLRTILRQHGLLTRDRRKVERKKYGLLKARKKTQYSKR